MTSLQPIWNPYEYGARQSFQESWEFELVDPQSFATLWLRFQILISRNGFRRISEVWALISRRQTDGAVSNTLLRQTFDLSDYEAVTINHIRIGTAHLILSDRNGSTSGSIRSKNNTFEWELAFDAPLSPPLEIFPHSLKRKALFASTCATLCPRLTVTGSTLLNGVKTQWQTAAGAIRHLTGASLGSQWYASRCRTFTTEAGASVDFIFEAFSGNVRPSGPYFFKNFRSFYFIYGGKPYQFNGPLESLLTKSSAAPAGWTFELSRGDLCFRGQLTSNPKDFAGTSTEDTDGSLLYFSNSRFCDLKIQTYRLGKLEASLVSNHTASFEIGSRDKNPYVSF